MRAAAAGRLFGGAVAALVALVAASCGSDPSTSRPSDREPEPSGQILVSAAASLNEPFTTIVEGFTAEHPGAEVTLNFGSSGQLSNQIREGAPADVAAFANPETMRSLEDAELLAGPPTTFATNALVVVTPPGNPADVASLADLPAVGIVARCADTAPCGSFTERVLAEAGVVIPEERVTRGADVKATLTAVTEGDADAAIVYRTDAVAAGDSVQVVEIPAAQNVVARYPIAVVADSTNAAVADAFVAYVLSDAGQIVLRDDGFGSP